MHATDLHEETSAPTRRHWWRTLTFHRAIPTSSHAPGSAEDEDTEDTHSPGVARPKWVDNQTAHRVNR